MMIKCFTLLTFFLCTAALSCWKLEGFPTIQSQDESIALGHGLNKTMSLEAKNGGKEEADKKHGMFVSEKSQRGKGAYGGANIAHRPRQGKNAASSLINPLSSLSTAVLHVSLTVILAFPYLPLDFKLF